MLELDREQVRGLGAVAAAKQAVTFLTRPDGPQGFWIHIDADVFDESIMRAVDDPRPNGLAWEDLVSVVRVAIASGAAVGLQIAIYNPDFDPDGSNGRGLAATIRDALIAGVSAGGGCVA
jgi:arginase